MRRERVLYENPDIQSRAALLLLEKTYIRQVAYHGYQGWLRFRWETLSKILLDKGVLECYYCKKKPLLIDEDNNHPMVATLDHVIPRSKGGAEFDLTNLVVACRPCNAKKKDTILTKDFIFQSSPYESQTSFKVNSEPTSSNLFIGPKAPMIVGKLAKFSELGIGDKFALININPAIFYVKIGFQQAVAVGGGHIGIWPSNSCVYYYGTSKNCSVILPGNAENYSSVTKKSTMYSG